MSAAKTLSGGCLCGAVRYTASSKTLSYSVCHCDMCRKIASAGFMSLPCGDTVQVQDNTWLGTYDSSAWAERSFCKKCGTPLFYKLKGSGDVSVANGTFDDTKDFKFDRQFFIDEKPAHFVFSNTTKNITSAEIHATYPELLGGDQNG